MVKWWNNSGTVKRDRNIFSSRPVIWQSVKCLGGPQEMMSRRDAGFDVVIAVGVNLRRPKSADDPSQLGTKATMPRVIMSGGAKFDAIDTSDGTVILQGEYSADRTKQRIGERPVYHGYETLYRMTESEDSFLTRLISGLLASVPEYHPQKTTSPLK
jgi:hypothetical protein